LYRIWTHEKTSESLLELQKWTYPMYCKGNEWLDAVDDAERMEQERIKRESQQK